MIFWVIVGGLCALAVGLLVLPLLRRPGESAPRAAYDLNVYKDQLAEIAREIARGELSRRLLPYVQRFFEGWPLEHGAPHYYYNSREI